MCSSKTTTVEEKSLAQPGTSEYYNAKRVPSWCDRVLVHSLAGAKGSIEEVRRRSHTSHDVGPRPGLCSLPSAPQIASARQVSPTSDVEAHDASGDSHVHRRRDWKERRLIRVRPLVCSSHHIVLPVAREVSSTHVARDDKQPKEIGKYVFPPQNLPSTLVGYDASDEKLRIAQQKTQARFALLTENERKR